MDQCIDKTVSELVEFTLDAYVPKSLRDQVDGSRDELCALRVQLHNLLRILHTQDSPQFTDSQSSGMPVVRMRVLKL